MAGFLPPAIFEIKAVADGAIAKFKDVNNELEKMDKKSQDAGGSVSKLDGASRVATAGLLAMGAAFVGFAAVGIKGVIEDEKAFTKLGQTFSNLGINIEKNRTLVGELDAAYSKLGFGGDETATALNRLLSTTGNLEKSQELLSISADLARIKNIDLAAASAIVGKASMGGAKAFKEMGITLDTTLPKSEAITKAMGELNEKVGGQAVAYTKTFAGQLVVLREQISGVADILGAALLPYLKRAIEAIAGGIDFVKRNAAAFKILAGTIITITIALASYNAAIKVSMALTKAWTVVTTIQKMVTNLLTGQQIALNTAMKMNPVGLVVAAVVLLIGAFVLLWNKSEPFRKIMIDIGKVGLKALGGLISIVGLLATGLLKIVLGPMKLLLKGLSLLGVDAAGTALKGIEKATDGVGKFFDGAAKKVNELAGGLDKFNKPIKLTFGAIKVPEIPNVEGAKGGAGGAGGAGGLSGAEAKKALDAKKKDNEGYMKIVADLNKKVISAKEKFNDEMESLEKDHANKIISLNADAAEKVASTTKDHEAKIAKLNKDATDKTFKLKSDAAKKILKLEADAKTKITDLESASKEKVLGIQQDFNNKMADLNKKKSEDLAKLEIDNQKKIESITKQGAANLASIVKQSVDRLRDAYARGTEFKLGDVFKGLVEAGTVSAEQLVVSMRTKLEGMRLLARNAARLAEQGFSQTFIEQVVSSGAEIGNQLSGTILNSTPETISELRSLYNQIDAQTTTGLDALANSMSTGARLATSELTQAYAEAQKDTADALAAQAQDYVNSQAEISKVFSETMGQAEKDRDTAIAQAHKDLAESITAVNKQLKESIDSINADLAEALAQVNSDLSEAIAEENATFAEALLEIQTALDTALSDEMIAFAEKQDEAREALTEALDGIQAEFEDKLGKITNATKATTTAINAMVTALNAARDLAAKPMPTPPIVTPPVLSAGAVKTGALTNDEYLKESGGGAGGGSKVVMYNNITNNNTTSDTDIGNTIVRIAKFGLVVAE
jgi:hypothetical protein